MRLQRVLCGAATSVAVAAATLVASTAGASADPPGPWQPIRSEPFTNPAGTVCAFGLKGDILSDHERIRTLTTNPDGSPLEQEVAGQLIIRFTNMATGASVVRNDTGTGWFINGPDGSFTAHADGHLSIGIHIGNPPPTPPGEWQLTGTFDFAVNADGTKSFTLEHGTAENLCETLA